MAWIDFHHPDISWPVVRRHAKIEFMEILELSALFMSRGGWAVINRSCYPSDAAYRSAKSRLFKQGLIAKRSVNAASPELRLTETGKSFVPAYFHPEKCWNRTWNKIWYLLVYDVPETDRAYRDVLRRFLKTKRLGQLQQSVWITPEDIRPDFDDLCEAANINSFAFLFESRTVLGLSSRSVIETAWPMELLRDRQVHFCKVAAENLAQLQSGAHAPDDLSRLSRLTLSAYHSVMAGDPLLPSALLPRRYAGRQAYAAFLALQEEVGRQLECCS